MTHSRDETKVMDQNVKKSTQEDKDPDCVRACRQSAKGIIEQKIKALRQEAINYETILNMLPSNPTPEQDAALWNIFVNHR